MSENMLSAAIVTYKGKEQAVYTINSVLQHTNKYPLSLYVIDNASKDSTLDEIGKIEGVTLICQDKNLGFGGGHNAALNEKLGEYHAVINPDIELNSDILSYFVDVMEKNSDIAMITPKILSDDGSEQHLPKRHPTLRYLFLGRLSGLGGVFKKIRKEYTRQEENLDKPTDIEFCTGCFFLIRSEIFKQIGGFDKRYFMYMEDADLSREVLKYGRVVFDPTVSVKHLWKRESAKSIKFLIMHTSSAFKYLKKWRKRK